ncbi:MAG: parallel beta-helix domain-containing protein [Rhodothermales bacterium]
MPSLLKKTTAGTIVLTLVFVSLLFLPLPGLAPSQTPVDVARAIETRGLEHFERIVEGQNLDRPFPEMPVRPDNPLTAERVELGRLLFFDPVLSGGNDISCATCHHPDLGFSDNRLTSMGVGGRHLGRGRTGGASLRRNAPTLWNAAFNHRQFWDGRAADLEAQAAGPIQDPSEMAQDPDELVRELERIPAYVRAFREAFEDAGDAPISFERVTYAIAAFERTLTSRNARYDRYAAGDRSALSPSERRGLDLFRSLKTRCFECHNLPTFANPDFKIIGVPDGDLEPDLGRAEVEGQGYERAFKVPTLRNVALTAPYMHNGVFETLGEVLDFYGGGGGRGLGDTIPNQDDKIRPFTLTVREKDDLINFLHALTDESARPAIPERVPSGLPVVPRLENESAELRYHQASPPPQEAVPVRRVGRTLYVDYGQRIQHALDAAQPGDTISVAPGIYRETLSLDVSNITLMGVQEGDLRPILDGQGILADGIVGSGSHIAIVGFTVRNYTANGVMIDRAMDVVFRELYLENTGLYGLYPVEVVGVTIERCRVTGARDAGIYVGQSKNIIVRENTVYGNVTGIEIENSVDALVENNDVHDNAGGILVFLLPNNPSKISRGAVVRANRVYSNNHENFADPDAIVKRVPSGTGVMILAADAVRVSGNEVINNQSAGIALLGLDSVFGAGTAYDVDPFPDDNLIYDNTLEANGLSPDVRVLEAGLHGADLLWDLSGTNNSWDQPEATRLPYTLPASTWSPMLRRANDRVWRLLASL